MPDHFPGITASFFLDRLLAHHGTYPTKALEQRLEAGEAQCRICGPGASDFARVLGQEILMLGGRILLCGADQQQLDEWQSNLLDTKLVPQVKAPIELRQKLTRYAANLSLQRAQVFDHYDVAATTGLWLNHRRSAANDLLSSQISFSDFEFTPAEFLASSKQIQITQRLYQKVGYLAPAFQELNAGIFKHQTLEDSRVFIEQALTNFRQQATNLQRDYATQLNLFYRKRRSWYLMVYNSLINIVTALQDQRYALEEELGTAALSSVPGSLLAGLSKKQKRHRTAIIDLYASLTKLKEEHQEAAPFVFAWPEKPSALPQAAWPALLQRYQTALEEWFSDHRRYIKEESLGLNAVTAPENSTTADELKALEERLRQLVEGLNDSGLFQRPFQAEATTASRRQKILEQLLEKLQLLKRLMPDYEAFYRWQHNWFSLPARLRRVIAPLLAFPEDDWQASFAAWYYERGLDAKANARYQVQSPGALANLMDVVITARTSLEQGSNQKGLAAHALATYLSGQHLPGGKFDYVFILDNDLANPLPQLPALRIGILPTFTDEDYYLNCSGKFQPALAIFQTWHGRQFPAWQASVVKDAKAVAIAATQHFIAQQKVNTPSNGASEELQSSHKHTGDGQEAPASWPSPPAKPGSKHLSAFTVNGVLANQNAPFQVLMYMEGKTSPQVIPLADYCGQPSEVAQLLIKEGTDLSMLTETVELDPTYLRQMEACFQLLLSAPKIGIFHPFTPDQITQALLTDGLNFAFVIAAIIRASEAVVDQDQRGFRAITLEIRKRLGSEQITANPLIKELVPLFKAALPECSISTHLGWRDTYLPLVIQTPNGQKHLLLLDGDLPGPPATGLVLLSRLQELRAAGFKMQFVLSKNVFDDPADEVEKIVANIKGKG